MGIETTALQGRNQAMNLSSIHAGDAARPIATAPARPRPTEGSAPSPRSDEQIIADNLASLDDALDQGNLPQARKALSGIRTSAGLQGEAIAGEADPLSSISSALGSDDLDGARKAWSEFRSALGDDEPVDYTLTVTRTATFSILA